MKTQTPTTIDGYDDGLPSVHRLKCAPEYYAQLWNGDKPFELRRDDREYRVGDVLMLCEMDSPTEYSGRWIMARVTSLLDGDGYQADVLNYGGQDGPNDIGYVVMGIHEFARDDRGTA